MLADRGSVLVWRCRLRRRHIWRAVCRQLHDHAGTATRAGGLDPRRASVQGNQLADNGQSDSTAAGRRFRAAIQADVRLPHSVAIGRRNPGPLILDPEAHAGAIRRRRGGTANRDRLSGRTILGGVVEEVEQDLTECVTIGTHREPAGRGEADRHPA